MSGQVSLGSAGEYQADEQAGVASHLFRNFPVYDLAYIHTYIGH